MGSSGDGSNAVKRRLKGLLALLPESARLYPYQRNDNHQPLVTAADELDGNFVIGLTGSRQKIHNTTSKIISRKQQRRRMKRYQQEMHEAALISISIGSIDVEDGTCDDKGIDDVLNKNHVIMQQTPNPSNEMVKISEMVHDNDIVVVFLFDPYQPYSLQLLQKLIAVYQLSNDNKHHQNDHPLGTASSIPTNNNDDGVSTDTNQLSKLHCLVATSSIDTIAIDQLLVGTGVILLPWTSNDTFRHDGLSSSSSLSPSYWKVAMGGANVCPSILGIIECSKGRNLFPINHEELALDWNTSMNVYNSWCHEGKSAFTTIQRIQASALYPTTSICSIM